MNADIYVVTQYFTDDMRDLAWPETILVTADAVKARALTEDHPCTEDSTSHYVMTRWRGDEQVAAHYIYHGQWDGHGELR